MSIRNTNYIQILILAIGFLTIKEYVVIANESVRLYTPYTKISVSPGTTIDYTIDVKNMSDEILNINMNISGLPRDWDYFLKSGGWNIKQLSILPGQSKNLSLKVEVPQKVNKGNYQFKVIAGKFDVLLITINVSERGTFKTEFTSDQINMEGHTKSTFTYKAKIKNQTGDKQLYSLRAKIPRGWKVTFKPQNKKATSVEIEENSTKDITIEIKPPENIDAGTYKIPVSALTKTTAATLELEVVITGTYEMNLTTPNGLLSTNITAGHEKRLELLIINTGSSELKDIKFSSNKPANWEVIFDPQKIEKLEAGKKINVIASIKADDKAIAGDYVTKISASTPETSSKASIRISVKTPMFWGWIGILIIIIALGSVYYLFRKYGRR